MAQRLWLRVLWRALLPQARVTAQHPIVQLWGLSVGPDDVGTAEISCVDVTHRIVGSHHIGEIVAEGRLASLNA